MEQMQATGHQVVVVRNNAGEVVHTHEFVDFGDVEPRSEEEILNQAVEAAQNAHPVLGDEELTPAVSTKEELDRLRRQHIGRAPS